MMETLANNRILRDNVKQWLNYQNRGIAVGMKYVEYILGIFTMLIGIPANEDDAVAGLTLVALVVIIVATVKYIEDYFKIKELSKKKGENEKELPRKSRKSKDKIRKRQLDA